MLVPKTQVSELIYLSVAIVLISDSDDLRIDGAREITSDIGRLLYLCIHMSRLDLGWGQVAEPPLSSFLSGKFSSFFSIPEFSPPTWLVFQELQKAQKKKYIKKKPLLKEVEQPRPQESNLSVAAPAPTLATAPQLLTSSSPLPPPEPKQEALSGSLADHEYTARPNAFGMAQANRSTTPMAPGVFLTQRRPSVGSQSNQAGQGTTPI